MFKNLSFLIGASLLLINIVGIFIPLRNDAIYAENNRGVQDDIVLTEEELWQAINSEMESVPAYVTHINTAVNNGIAHYWEDEGIEKYNLRIPIHENYFLYLSRWLFPVVFEKYEFSRYEKAIERGIGLCSQQSIIISEILKDKGIQSRIIRLDGHVVATAKVHNDPETWWVLDPDYGVVIPHSINEIELDPSIISPYYSAAGYDDERIHLLMGKYGPKGNIVVDGVKLYDSRAKSYALRYYIESITYPLKWVLPLLLMLPLIRQLQRAFR